jgi:hypothetical protein
MKIATKLEQHAGKMCQMHQSLHTNWKVGLNTELQVMSACCSGNKNNDCALLVFLFIIVQNLHVYFFSIPVNVYEFGAH